MHAEVKAGNVRDVLETYKEKWPWLHGHRPVNWIAGCDA